MAAAAAVESCTPSRHEKSLGLLTTKFVSLLQSAEDGVLDLKMVSLTDSAVLISNDDDPDFVQICFRQFHFPRMHL